MTPAEKKTVAELMPHLSRSQVLADAMLHCAHQNGWTDGELVVAVPMAIAVVTPIEHLDMIMTLMQSMCDGRKVGEGLAGYS